MRKQPPSTTGKVKKIVWFARGGGLAKMGPFDTQIEATNRLRLSKSKPRFGEPVDNSIFPPDAFVWPEEA